MTTKDERTREMYGAEKCVRCGMPRSDHNAASLHCPVGHWDFSKSNIFEAGAPLEDIPAKDDDMTAKQMLLDRMVASFPKRDQSELKREIAQMSWAERLTKYEELRLASSVIPCGTSNVTMVDPTQFQKAVAPEQTQSTQVTQEYTAWASRGEEEYRRGFLAGQRSAIAEIKAWADAQHLKEREIRAAIVYSDVMSKCAELER